MSSLGTSVVVQVAGHLGLDLALEPATHTSTPRRMTSRCRHGGHQGTVDDAIGLLGTEEPCNKNGGDDFVAANHPDFFVWDGKKCYPNI